LGFACFGFLRSLWCNISALIWHLCVLLIYALMGINFPLKTVFAVSHRFWHVVFSFSLTSRKL
jgi:hypothetical protein